MLFVLLYAGKQENKKKQGLEGLSEIASVLPRGLEIGLGVRDFLLTLKAQPSTGKRKKADTVSYVYSSLTVVRVEYAPGVEMQKCRVPW